MNRSQRCGVCRGCQAKPCGNCTYCQDSPQFGGPGVKKQSCIERRCLRVLENRLQRDAPTFKAKAGCNQCDDCRVADCQVCLVCLDKRFFENRHMTGAMCAKKRCNNARTIELPSLYPPQNGTPNHNGNSNGTDSPNGHHGGVYAEVFHNRQQAPPNGVHHTPQPQMISLKRPAEPLSVMDGPAQAKLQRRPFPGAAQPGANTQTVAITHQPILPLPTKMVPVANGHGGYPQQPYVATVVQMPVVGLQQQTMGSHYAFSQPVQLIAAPQANHPTMANQPLVAAPAPSHTHSHAHHQLSNGNGALSLNSSAPSTLLSASLIDGPVHHNHHHLHHQALASWTNGASDVFDDPTQPNICDPFLPPSYAPGKNAVVLQQL
uniref:CXXC-type domain-containing protein n=1 Tax=Plectus sambesii TaxID=2011161 RepID=A0A914V8D1_9BILA